MNKTQRRRAFASKLETQMFPSKTCRIYAPKQYLIQNMNRTVIPSENLPKTIIKAPRALLEKIKQYATNKNLSLIEFTDQTQIPNFMKLSTQARKMIIAYSPEEVTRPLNLHRLIGSTVRSMMHVHVAEGKVSLLSRDINDRFDKDIPETITMDWRSSWELTNKLMSKRRFILRPIRLPLILVVEIFQRESCPYPRIFGHILPATLGLIEQEGSVVWDNNAEIVFMATRFAHSAKQRHPIHIALLSDGGGVEMDTFICPRHIISNYGTDQHCLTEDDIIGQTDEYAAYDSLRVRLQKRIVVGYSIYDQLESLRIDLTELAGIREIKSNPCFGTKAMSNYSFTIQRLASVYLQRPLGHAINDAYEEAMIVRQLYLTREAQWMDDNDPDNDSWRSWVMKNPVIGSQHHIPNKVSQVEDLFAELPETFSPKAITKNSLFDDDDYMEDYQSCTSLMDEGYEDINITVENDEYSQELCPDEINKYSINEEEDGKINSCQELCPVDVNSHLQSSNQELCLEEDLNVCNNDDDALMMTGQSPPIQASIKQEKTYWPEVPYHNTEELLKDARHFDKNNNNMERLETQSNGFWIPSLRARRNNIRATDIDNGGIFYPPCPVFVQFVDLKSFKRLPYRNIPPLTEEEWDGEYFEIFYTPENIRNHPASEWSDFGSEIFKEGRDYLRLLMPPPQPTVSWCQ